MFALARGPLDPPSQGPGEGFQILWTDPGNLDSEMALCALTGILLTNLCSTVWLWYTWNMQVAAGGIHVRKGLRGSLVDEARETHSLSSLKVRMLGMPPEAACAPHIHHISTNVDTNILGCVQMWTCLEGIHAGLSVCTSDGRGWRIEGAWTAKACLDGQVKGAQTHSPQTLESVPYKTCMLVRRRTYGSRLYGDPDPAVPG